MPRTEANPSVTAPQKLRIGSREAATDCRFALRDLLLRGGRPTALSMGIVGRGKLSRQLAKDLVPALAHGSARISFLTGGRARARGPSPRDHWQGERGPSLALSR